MGEFVLWEVDRGGLRVGAAIKIILVAESPNRRLCGGFIVVVFELVFII